MTRYMKLKYKHTVVLVVTLVGLIFLLRRCSQEESVSGGRDLTAEAKSGELVISVRASGEILTRDANKIIPKIKRIVTVSFLVPEGSRVKKDEIIAQFAPEELDQRISEAEALLADRELAVAAARTDLEIQELDNANTFKLAQQAVQDATLELEKFIKGDEPMDIRAAELRIDTTISKRERAVKKHAEAKELLTEGFITEDQVEEDRIAMETADVEATTAEQELLILKEYDLPLRRNKANSAREKARTELEKTIKKNEVQAQNKRQALDAAVRARDRAALEHDNLRKEREDYDVRAPIDGVVNYGDPGNMWRNPEIQIGMTLSPGVVLMTIPDMTAMQANINVPEADVDKVKVGQTAQVFVEAIGRRTFGGDVVRVAEVANPGGWMSSDVKEFKVEVGIADGDGLRPGFTCDAEIIVERIPEALLLPVQAIFRDGDRWVVYKEPAAQPEKVPVVLGRSSVTHAQILEGLKAGDRVLLNPLESTP